MSGPLCAVDKRYAVLVEALGNRLETPVIIDKFVENACYHSDFLAWAWDEDDAFGCDTLPLTLH